MDSNDAWSISSFAHIIQILSPLAEGPSFRSFRLTRLEKTPTKPGGTELSSRMWKHRSDYVGQLKQ